MEMECFISDDADWKYEQQQWIQRYWKWLIDIGIKEDRLSREVHEKEDLSHYALGFTDITFKYPFSKMIFAHPTGTTRDRLGDSELMVIGAHEKLKLWHEPSSS